MEIELLSPAGSPDSLTAAVSFGADAVYLGLGEFNARVNAMNFTRSNLREHIEFCHIRGVKVYLTLNTLLYDDEVQKAYNAACFAYNMGIDAVILQDMGFSDILKKEIPGLSQHASTQMAVNSPNGVHHMGKQGFSRVILAREMNIESIREASATGINTEVFVHGARCYSFSGQCLMSSMLGGRSGNRGFCAQPCRLPYTLTDDMGNILLKGHLLSLKDIYYIKSLNQLKKAGVSALKIEGRMKNPEYVSAVTRVYRKYLDMGSEYEIEDDDYNDLLKAFNRQGFSMGALSNNPGINEFSRSTPKNSGVEVGRVISGTDNGSLVEFSADVRSGDGLKLNNGGNYAGKNIISGSKTLIPIAGRPGDRVFRTKDTVFQKKYGTASIIKNRTGIPLKAIAGFSEGKPAEIILLDNSGNEVREYSGSIVQKAHSGGTPCSRIREQLMKTGDTPFDIGQLELNCSEGIFIKITEINEMRRNALDSIAGIRKGPVHDLLPINLKNPVTRLLDINDANPSDNEFSLCLYKLPKGLDITAIDVARIYADALIPINMLKEIRQACIISGKEFLIHIPYAYEKLPEIECDGYLIENHGMLENLEKSTTVLGTGFNITNSRTADHYSGANAVTISYEMKEETISELLKHSNISFEMVVYGKIQVMESPYCPARDICRGDLCIKSELHLIDRMGEEWDILFNPSNHHVRIFNPHHLVLTERLKRLSGYGINRFRINIVNETAEEVIEIIEAMRQNRGPQLNPSYKFTNGHF